MNTIIYFLIFLFKVTENTLSTLRIIVVANGKKLLGAILQGIIAIVWVLSTSMVVVNIQKNPIKVLAFTLGSLIGSYIGSMIEEKIAMGSNMLTIAVKKELSNKIMTELKKMGYEIITINGKKQDKYKDILIIVVKRKKRKEIIKKIKSIDNKATFIVENAYIYLSK